MLFSNLTTPKQLNTNSTSSVYFAAKSEVRRTTKPRHSTDTFTRRRPLRATPQQLFEALQPYIVGQNVAVRRVVLAIYKHLTDTGLIQVGQTSKPLTNSLNDDLSPEQTELATYEEKIKNGLHRVVSPEMVANILAPLLRSTDEGSAVLFEVIAETLSSQKIVKTETLRNYLLGQTTAAFDNQCFTLKEGEQLEDVILTFLTKLEGLLNKRQKWAEAEAPKLLLKQSLEDAKTIDIKEFTPSTNPFLRVQDSPKDLKLKKPNVLMLGPTGSGKTELIRQVLEALKTAGIDIPFIRFDANQLTEQGYVGLKTEDIALQLFEAAGRNIEKAQRGIIFLDEIDKKAMPKSDSGRDVSGEGAQNALLPVLEDGEITFEFNHTSYTMDMTNVMVIGGGAFAGGGGKPSLIEIIRERLEKDGKISSGKAPLGFSNQAAPATASDADIATQVTPEDLIAYGLKPEMVGRFSTIAPLVKHNQQELLTILTEPNNALVKQYQYELSQYGVELAFTPEALEAIASEAFNLDTGGRALGTVMSRVTEDIRWQAATLGGKKVTVTLETLKDSRQFLIENQQAKKKAPKFGNRLQLVA